MARLVEWIAQSLSKGWASSPIIAIEGLMCRDLCHNPAIPARVGPSLAVSLSHTQKAANQRQTRMNTASLCRFVWFGSLPYQCSQRFDTEEVAGSNPVVPTININNLHRFYDYSGGFCVMVCVITPHSSAF